MNDQKYKLTDFLPLIVIFSIIILFVGLRQFFIGLNLNLAMYNFMGAFFIVFSIFKIINLKNFAEAYSIYDLVAQRSIIYAYLYPFIELSLGIAYFLHWQPFIINLITLVIMLIGALGVANELRKNKTIMCACLGTVFKIPMTYVTLFEDLLMAAMALYMLIKYMLIK